MDHRTVSNYRDFTAVAQYLAFADLEQLGFAIDRNTNAIAARITHRCRAGVLEHREHHVAHFAFIFRRHHDDVWHRPQIRDIEQAVMCLSVATGNAAAIETKLHVQILNTNVMNHLVEATLKERGVDRANGFESFTREAGSKSDAVLLGDADVERTFRKLLERRAHAGAIRHRRSQRYNFRILLHQLSERVAEDCRVGRNL